MVRSFADPMAQGTVLVLYSFLCFLKTIDSSSISEQKNFCQAIRRSDKTIFVHFNQKFAKIETQKKLTYTLSVFWYYIES